MKQVSVCYGSELLILSIVAWEELHCNWRYCNFTTEVDIMAKRSMYNIKDDLKLINF